MVNSKGSYRFKATVVPPAEDCPHFSLSSLNRWFEGLESFPLSI